MFKKYLFLKNAYQKLIQKEKKDAAKKIINALNYKTINIKKKYENDTYFKMNKIFNNQVYKQDSCFR